MKPKKVVIKVIPVYSSSYHIEYECPKCHAEFTTYGFDYTTITRFKCRCGQEIIADYQIQKANKS